MLSRVHLVEVAENFERPREVSGYPVFRISQVYVSRFWTYFFYRCRSSCSQSFSRIPGTTHIMLLTTVATVVAVVSGSMIRLLSIWRFVSISPRKDPDDSCDTFSSTDISFGSIASGLATFLNSKGERGETIACSTR